MSVYVLLKCVIFMTLVCCFSFLGLDSQISLTVHQADDDLDDCRVVMGTSDLNEIVTSLLR